MADAKTGEIAWSRDRGVFSFQGRLQGNIDVEQRPELRLRVSAGGYQPAVSRVFKAAEKRVECNFALKRVSTP